MKKHLLTAIIGVSVIAAQGVKAETPTLEQLWEVIQQQEQEIEALKKEQAETDVKIEATVEAIENGLESTDKSMEWASKTKVGGYGEHHFSNFEGKSDKVDAHRYVLFVGHEYSDTLRFFSEFELEHGIAGDDQPGEVELEQAFIEWDFAENHSAVAGQFLVPVGILNETHEPDTFYGTERNLVEKKILSRPRGGRPAFYSRVLSLRE